MKEVYIVSAKRTPVGGFLGSLSGFAATALGAMAIKATCPLELREKIDAVYMGNVLSAGLGQSPARQAALKAGIAVSTDCTTINKVCASGLKAVMIAAQQLQAGDAHLLIAGGMESMSNAPHYDYRRSLQKLGNIALLDGILHDGLTDAYDHLHMGSLAERCVSEFGLTREEQDAYSLDSYRKAAEASDAGKFDQEIIPVSVNNAGQGVLLTEDEDIRKLIIDKVPKLKPAFSDGGTITAASASNLNDGAAALLLASAEAVKKYDLQPLARIIASADAAVSPARFTTAPAIAIPKVLEASGLALKDIDYIELNEAYAAVVLSNQQILGLESGKLNVYGGAVAIGHPIGASGARILCTLLSVLRQENGRYGLAAICNGGGGASAMTVENLMN